MELDRVSSVDSNRGAGFVPLRTTQLVLAALSGGLVVFAATSSFVRATTPMGVDDGVLQVLTLVVVASYFAAAAAYVVVRGSFVARIAASRTEALEHARRGLVPAPLHALAITGATLVEAPGLLGTVTLLLGGPWHLVAAPLVSALAIAAMIPTRGRVEMLVNELRA